MAIGIQMPIWIAGIEPETFDSIRGRYEEMRTVAEANGVECHPYDSAAGATAPLDPELEADADESQGVP
jgi:hypothetical protein